MDANRSTLAQGFSAGWLALKHAEEDFLTKRMSFFSQPLPDQITDLRNALSGEPSQVEFALRLLDTMAPTVAQYLVRELLLLAIDGAEVLAPQALNIVLRSGPLSEQEVAAIVETTLAVSQPDFYLFSRISQLYYRAGFGKSLRSFLENYCSDSADQDIRELAQEYSMD